MRKVGLMVLGVLVPFCLVSSLYAQDSVPCTDQDKATLEQCKVTCEAAVPQCQNATKPQISLEEVRATIAEKCDCTKARNYGQYES